jgi:hypothetical protein
MSVARPPDPTPGQFLRAVGPSVAAGAATMLVPEATIPAALLRMAIAGGTGAAADAGVQSLRGQPVDASSLGRGALEGLFQGGAEVLSPFLKMLSHALMKSALNVKPSVVDDAVRIRSMQENRIVAPHEIDLAGDAIKQRLAPGTAKLTPWNESGYHQINEAQTERMTRRAEILKDATSRGVTYTAQDFTTHLPELRKDMRLGPNGVKNSETLQSVIDDFITQFREPDRVVKYKTSTGKVATRTVKGKMLQFTPENVEMLKEKWQTWAQNAYKTKNAEKLAVLEKFTEAIAKGMKERLQELTPAAVAGGVGELEAINRAHQASLPLEQALYDAEKPRASLGGSLKDLNPVHLMTPPVRGRAALLGDVLAGPTARAVGPHATTGALYSLMELLKDNTAADSTAGAKR